MTAKGIENKKNNTKRYQNPRRTFEKSGLVNPEASYYVSLENVVNTDNQDIKTMVDQGRFFSIFAPRQSGKTTFMEHFCRELEKDPTYVAVLLSFEKFSKLNVRRFYGEIQKSLYRQLTARLAALDCDKLEHINSHLSSHDLTDHIDFGNLFEELNRIIQHKKIIIFIDEFDGIPLEELGNFLATIRALYQDYKRVKQKALYSIGLMGIRNITRLVIGGISPFNIADQVAMPPFSLQNVRDLYTQYTEETNQPFTEEAMEKIHRETAGQPWLVNRLGTILTVNIKPGTLEPIDTEDVDAAIQKLLKERNAHFDNLYEKAKLYKETFVEIVFDHVQYKPDSEDQTCLEQYGLIKAKETATEYKAVVANTIYKKRYLDTFFDEANVPGNMSHSGYRLPGNRLDMERVLVQFGQYITQIGVSAFYREEKPYERTGQFLLTAWLYQLIKDGAGQLRYEVPGGLGRMDILLTYLDEKYIIETKVNRYGDISRTVKEGIEQLTEKYMPTESLQEGFLVVFDTRSPVGSHHETQIHEKGDQKITCCIIAIGRTDNIN